MKVKKAVSGGGSWRTHIGARVEVMGCVCFRVHPYRMKRVVLAGGFRPERNHGAHTFAVITKISERIARIGIRAPSTGRVRGE